MNIKKNEIHVYTDGSSHGNPGQGGYGIIILYNNFGNSYVKKISGGFNYTTNNRMELTAVILALENIKINTNNKKIIIFTDSKYIVNAIEKKWVFSWEKNNFNKKKMLIYGNVY